MEEDSRYIEIQSSANRIPHENLRYRIHEENFEINLRAQNHSRIFLAYMTHNLADSNSSISLGAQIYHKLGSDYRFSLIIGRESRLLDRF